MAMLQHYYTSCIQGLSGGAGFQVKAKSPGISQETEQVLNRMIGYQIPSSLDEHAIEQHPVALRYQYIDAQTCALTCSQSNGTDENGRPGNFFAHSVVTSPEDFFHFPPIMYWRHSFWRTQDRSNRTEIPPKESFDLEPSLEFEDIWPFLDTGNRREWFARLLAAAVSVDDTGRRIIILDEIDNIALWIGAITFALPAMYRPFLSFATYHHDPYQVPFHITGTRSDSRFRFTQDEYLSYFILNAPGGRVSEAEDSIYANFVARHFYPERYEQKLLELFKFCQDKLPSRSPHHMRHKLDAAANLFLTIRERSLAPTDPQAQTSLSFFLREYESKVTLTGEELEDLGATANLLQEAIGRRQAEVLLSHYERVLILLKQHDADYLHRCRADLQMLAWLLIQGDTKLTEKLLEIFRAVYGDTHLSQSISRPAFLEQLDQILSRDIGITVHTALWQTIGPFLQLDASRVESVKPLLRKTLDALGHSTRSDPVLVPEPAAPLLQSLTSTFARGKQIYLLRAALPDDEPKPPSAFFWLYYQIVGELPLEQRKSYRKQLSSWISSEDLIEYEFSYEIRRLRSGIDVPRLETWLTHLNDYRQLSPGIVENWLNYFEHKIDRGTATQLLLSGKIAPFLSTEWHERLANKTMRLKGFERPSDDLVELYRHHLNDPTVNEAERALVGGSLALADGRFEEETISDIGGWLEQQDEDVYQQEAEKLISRFFEADTTMLNHERMLLAVFTQRHESIFWELYWTSFQALWTSGPGATTLAKLLTYWFDVAPRHLSRRRYLVPAFFLQLPSVLEKISGERACRRGRKQLAQLATTQAWYPLVAEYLEQKGRLFGILNR